MIVVSDTTPLISLMKIGELNLLEKLFGQIVIPRAVYEELVSNEKFLSEGKQIRASKFIVIQDVNDLKLVDLLRRSTGLDAGESEAIILSDQNKSTLLLMDEVKGRQVAKQMGIHIMGTIGLLMVAYEEKYLDSNEIRNCIDILKVSGRHIGNNLYRQLIDKIESDNTELKN